MTTSPRTTKRPAPCRDDSRQVIWCTGKDSNLRTSEEGQIYSLLALTTHPPVQNCRAVRPYLLIRHSSQTCTLREDRSDGLLQTTKPSKVRTEMRAKMPSHANTTLGKFPYGVPLENLLRRRAAQISCASGTISWSWRRDLNPRPSDYKSDALPAELRQQFLDRSLPSRAQDTP